MPGNFSAPATPERLETKTIDPPRPRISLNASREQKNAPSRPAPSWTSQSAALVSTNGFLISTAAQWTSASNDFRRLNASTTWRSFETSQPSLRLNEVTSQCSARSSRTTSEPIPPEPPVTTACNVIATPPSAQPRTGRGLRRDQDVARRWPEPRLGRARDNRGSPRRGSRRRPDPQASRRLRLRPPQASRLDRTRPQGPPPSATRRPPCRTAPASGR